MELSDLFEKVNKNYINFKGSPRKRELKKEMEREIKRFSKMSSDDKAAYPDDWTADKKYKADLKKRGKTLPKSSHTKKFHQMYGESMNFKQFLEDSTLTEGNTEEALKNKAEKTGFKYDILKKVFDRGMAAWRTGHRPGVVQHQWAMGRVNSFITGGPARKVDQDLWDKRK